LDARTPAAALPRDRTGDVIDVRGVSMRYSGANGGVLALKDINFAVADGEFMAIVGPSGCGKTTLLKILAGLLGGFEGRASLKGTPIAKPRRDIGVVFQSPVLFPWRSVLGNVMLPADVQRLNKVELRRRAMDLIIAIPGSSPEVCNNVSGSCARSCMIPRCS
jgi:NitT/TauT family transport system ATP-binding protein